MTVTPDFDVAFADAHTLRPSLYERIVQGQLGVLRNAPPVEMLRRMLLDAVETAGGGRARDEVAAWMHDRRTPGALASAHAANALAELRRAFIVPVLFSDSVGQFGFPRPLGLELGAPRIQVPKDVETELLGLTDVVNPGVLQNPGYDPSYHVMLVSEHAVHRDLGCACYHIQANFWCALQDIGEQEALLLFPDMFRDATPDRAFFHIAPEQKFDVDSWKLGRVARIPLRANDILVFSGDFLHCNPLQQGDVLRMSWEFRVITPYIEDVGWYRFGFLDQSSFELRPGSDAGADRRAQTVWQLWNAPLKSPADHFREAGADAIAWQYFGALVNHPDPNGTYLEQTLAILKNFPFADDRVLWPHFLAHRRKMPTLARRILEDAVDRTSSFYWSCVYGGMALGTDDRRLAMRAFKRARSLGRRTHVDISRSNLDYLRVLKGSASPIKPFIRPLIPDDVDAIISLYQTGQVAKGLSPDGVQLHRGIPYPALMFKPRYPFLNPEPRAPNIWEKLFPTRGGPDTRRSFTVAETWPPY